MSVVHVNDNNFNAEVMKSDKPVFVDFYADWCGPCKRVAPVIEELAKTYAGRAKFCKVNVDEAQNTAVQFGIMSIPTLIVFKNGEKKEQAMGALPKGQIEDMITKHFE